jgi:hypothetical protein
MCQRLALLHTPGKRNHYTFGPLVQLVTDHVPVGDLKLILVCSYVKISKNTRLAQPFEFRSNFYLMFRKHSKEG